MGKRITKGKGEEIKVGEKYLLGGISNIIM